MKKRMIEEEKLAAAEKLKDVQVVEGESRKTTSIGTTMGQRMEEELVRFLKVNSDVFSRTVHDLEGIDLEVMTHKLNVNPTFRPWLANVVLVPKSNKKWRMCIDFTDLNRACPKDSYPLPRINTLVDSTAGRKMMNFLDAFQDSCLEEPRGTALLQNSEKGGRFSWNKECPEAFDNLKEYLSKPPLLTKPQAGEILYIYLSTSEEAVSAVLVRAEGKEHQLIYYISKVLWRVEPMYPHREIGISFDSSSKETMPLLSVSPGDCANQSTSEAYPEVTGDEDSKRHQEWIMFVNGSFTSSKSRVGIVIKSPEADYMEHAITLEFSASNNKAGFEAILLGCKLIHAAGARRVRAYSDSQEQNLMANQLANWSAKNQFDGGKKITLLSSAAVNSEEEKKGEVEGLFIRENLTPTWTTPIVQFLTEGTLLEDRKEARKVKLRSARFVLIDGDLYKRGFLSPLLKCLSPDRAKYILREVHEGSCGNHSGTRSLTKKVLRGNQPDNPPTVENAIGRPKENWVHELPGVLWAYHTTPRESTQETPFSLVYETEAVLPAEIGEETWRIRSYNVRNSKSRREDLDFVEEKREAAERRIGIYKSKMARAYYDKVRPRKFEKGDLVLWKTETTGPVGKLEAKWDGPYIVTEVVGLGTYRLKRGDGKPLPHTWNVKNLKKYYI
ncbi:UNVERIFIED_CONTAM: hypothetical protein Slati_4489700 [Sesamum latifolium]|uniref:Reverse transcriptase/retrotransposon-derived protein RNase H-like domain-containing protein n=1 Tax=Sesamum latifolium TaxID=2727402 RepID=A0AAW2SSW5_9LAMI